MVANIGISGSGDANTISVIDLKLDPPRVVNSYTVGQTPEGIKMSPDGKFVAVTVMNGTNKPPGSPFYNDNGLLQVWTRNGTQLTKSAELPIGKWCQGVAWAGQQQDAAGAVHGRGGDHRGALLRPDRPLAAESRAPSRPRAARRASAPPSHRVCGRVSATPRNEGWTSTSTYIRPIARLGSPPPRRRSAGHSAVAGRRDLLVRGGGVHRARGHQVGAALPVPMT